MSGETNPEFNFSSGWLDRFKARHGIKSYGRFGESVLLFCKTIIAFLHSRSSGQFKENATGEGTVKKKGQQQVNHDINHSKNMDEDLEDSEEQVVLPGDSCMTKVDITCASNFEDIALKLKQTMKDIRE
ncbi:hypothetical protein QYF36_022075 [Acer negundo]|nr:hypothetical protein QYF36_022075 [Acer negundo]